MHLYSGHVGYLSALQKEAKPFSRVSQSRQYDNRTARAPASSGKRQEASYYFRMKRIHRLGRGKELNLLFARGVRLHSPLFQISVRVRPQSDSSDPSRFVFVVPRSVDKRAVIRNRLRRRAREYVRRSIGTLPRASDIAITIRKEAAAASRTNFYAELQDILARM